MSVRRDAWDSRRGPAGMLTSLALVLLLRLLQIQATETTPRTCAYGVVTPGVTVPQGDIIVEYGKPLEILCVLNLAHPQARNHDASDLRFYKNDTLVPSEYVHIMNDTTLRLYDERPAPSKTMYYCKLKPKGGAKDVGVCLNTVMVGFKPQPIDNFNCTSFNWMNLRCTWVPKYNPVLTTYKLKFRLAGSPRSEFGCPNNTERQNMCFWDGSTDIPYRQVYAHYYFTIYGENELGTAKFPFPFNHYKNIIAAKPSVFKVLNKTSSSFFLEWMIPYPLDSWSSSTNILDQKVVYAYMGAKEDNDKEEPWTVAFRGQLNCTRLCSFNLTGLPYAHVLYDVRVYLKTHEAPEEYWSEPATVVQRTSPSIPPEPPKTDIGSFEVSGRLPNRDVTIYWQSLSEKLHAGNNFSYKIVDVLQNNISVPIRVNSTGKKSAVLRNISLEDNFLVRIASSNELGLSPYISEVHIPGSHESLPEPRSFTKTSMNNGVFKLTWNYPELDEHKIKNYTIFWCDSQNDRPETCTGFLNWTHVGSSARNISLGLKPIMYHFAISANSETASSGMVWASCSMLSDKVDKLKTVFVKTYNATSMTIEWKLDCTDANNVVRGFQIFYCMVKDKEGQQCKDAERNMTIFGDHTTGNGTVAGLQPYRTYKAAVAIVTKIGAGLKSDPVLCTLYEAAPSSPPVNIQVSAVTNSSMTVSWSPPPNRNGVLRYYEVHFNGNVTKVLVDNPIDESERTEVVLKDLIGYTNYSIQVKACTTACSDLSEPIIERTLIGEPGVVDIPEYVHLNHSQVIVRWKPPAPRGGNVDYYHLKVEKTPPESSSDPPLIYTVTSTEYQVPTDCNKGGGPIFKFSVRAVNVDGDTEYMGPWSEPLLGPCLQDLSILYYVLIAIVVGFLIVCAVGAAVCAKRIFRHYKDMRKLDVKIPNGILPFSSVPPGGVKDPDFGMDNWAGGGRGSVDPSGKTRPAADKERLLQRKEDGHGESSGCSSGHDTASSSTTSGTHVSTDSGTEVDQHEQGYNDANWQANMDALGGQKRDKLIQPSWDSYAQVGEVTNPFDKKPNGTPAIYPNLGVPTWLPNGYVAMTGTENMPNNKMMETAIPVISPVAAMQTKPSSGYVAHNAPMLTQATWSAPPPVADGYVQMGSKPSPVPPVPPGPGDKDEGAMEDDKEGEEVDELEDAAHVCVDSEADPTVLRPLAAKSPRAEGDVGMVTGDDCERTSAEAPLVPRLDKGYVSHSMPVPLKSSPVRHENARTAEKVSPVVKMDSAKPYTRWGESATYIARPEAVAATKTNASLGYVPHRQFETRPASGVVRE